METEDQDPYAFARGFMYALPFAIVSWIVIYALLKRFAAFLM